MILNIIAISSIVIAALTLAWQIYQHNEIIRRENRKALYFQYHKTLLILLGMPEENGPSFIDRQIASAFELRNYPDYYSVTERILERLVNKYDDKSIVDEINLTLEFIAKKKSKRKVW